MANKSGIQQGKIYKELEVDVLDTLEDWFMMDSACMYRLFVFGERCGVGFEVSGIELKLYVFDEDTIDFLDKTPDAAQALEVNTSQLENVFGEHHWKPDSLEAYVVQLMDHSNTLTQRQLERLLQAIISFFGGELPPEGEATYYTRSEEPNQEVTSNAKERIQKQAGGYRTVFESIILS